VGASRQEHEEHTMTDTTVKIHFEEEPCGRCGGTGTYSFNQRDGHVCWGCSGKKTRFSRRGRTAFDAYEKALAESAATVAVRDLKPGMRILAKAHGGLDGQARPWNHPAAWRTVAEVTVTEFTGRGAEKRVIVDVPCVLAKITFEDGKTWQAESSDHPAYWARGAYHTIYTIRAFAVGGQEAQAAREEVRRTIARRFTGAWLEGEEPPAPPVRKPRPVKEEETVTEPKQESKPLPVNKFPGDCRNCGNLVEAGQGERDRADGRWVVQHKEGECPAPKAAEETEGAPAEDDGATRVVLTRSQLYPEVARPGPAWQWCYAYAVNGAPAITYGTGLASLRDMLRRKFGRDVRIVESWKAQEATQERPARPAMPNKFPGKCHGCGVRVEEGKGERLHVDGQWITRHKDGECVKDTTVRVTEEGLYRIPGGATLGDGVYRVRLSERSGRLYAEAFTPHTEEGGGARFVYDPAAVYRLEPAHRMTAEEAAEIGRKLHTCMQCGEHLTDPKSIARGIGPVCRKKV
jgi:hypothetical protein